MKIRKYIASGRNGYWAVVLETNYMVTKYNRTYYLKAYTII